MKLGIVRVNTKKLIFLGMCGFINNYICSFSTVFRPIYSLLGVLRIYVLITDSLLDSSEYLYSFTHISFI